MTRRTRITVMSLDADTLAALDVAAETANAAGVPQDVPGNHGHGRSSMVRHIVRDWELLGGLERMQYRARKLQEEPK